MKNDSCIVDLQRRTADPTARERKECDKEFSSAHAHVRQFSKNAALEHTMSPRESDRDARCEVPYLIRACPAQNSTDAMYFSRSSGTPEPPSSTIVLRIIVIGCIGSS